MEISNITLNSLRNIYYDSNYPRTAITNSVTELSYFNNNIFNLYMYVKHTNKHISVPLFCRKYIDDNINKGNADESIVTLYVRNPPYKKRIAMSIIKLFNTIPFSDRIIKVTTNKGEVYYGGFGIILDKNMTPLFLCTMEGDYEDNKFTYNKAVVYVHPDVFGSNGLLEKAIVKTLIPVYSQNIISFIDSRGIRQYKPEVIIKDFTNDFFAKPSTPRVNEFNEDNVNNFLLDNIDDICL